MFCIAAPQTKRIKEPQRHYHIKEIGIENKVGIDRSNLGGLFRFRYDLIPSIRLHFADNLYPYRCTLSTKPFKYFIYIQQIQNDKLFTVSKLMLSSKIKLMTYLFQYDIN